MCRWPMLAHGPQVGVGNVAGALPMLVVGGGGRVDAMRAQQRAQLVAEPRAWVHPIGDRADWRDWCEVVVVKATPHLA